VGGRALLKFGPIPNCPQEGYDLAGAEVGRHNSEQTRRKEKPTRGEKEDREVKNQKRIVVADFF